MKLVICKLRVKLKTVKLPSSKLAEIGFYGSQCELHILKSSSDENDFTRRPPSSGHWAHKNLIESLEILFNDHWNANANRMRSPDRSALAWDQHKANTWYLRKWISTLHWIANDHKELIFIFLVKWLFILLFFSLARRTGITKTGAGVRILSLL